MHGQLRRAAGAVAPCVAPQGTRRGAGLAEVWGASQPAQWVDKHSSASCPRLPTHAAPGLTSCSPWPHLLHRIWRWWPERERDPWPGLLGESKAWPGLQAATCECSGAHAMSCRAVQAVQAMQETLGPTSSLPAQARGTLPQRVPPRLVPLAARSVGRAGQPLQLKASSN